MEQKRPVVSNARKGDVDTVVERFRHQAVKHVRDTELIMFTFTWNDPNVTFTQLRARLMDHGFPEPYEWKPRMQENGRKLYMMTVMLGDR